MQMLKHRRCTALSHSGRNKRIQSETCCSAQTVNRHSFKLATRWQSLHRDIAILYKASAPITPAAKSHWSYCCFNVPLSHKQMLFVKTKS